MRSMWWSLAFVIAAAGIVHSDPKAAAPVTGVFTAKSILGVKPSKDQIRIGESGNWRTAFNKCPDSNHQPPLRVGDPRMTTSKDITTIEMDFECGSCGGATCPSNQVCVETVTGANIQKSCEAKAPTRAGLTCAAPVDQHVRCTAAAAATKTTTCPQLGSACKKEGDTCGSEAAAKATSFSNFMRCSGGKWENVEVPPPAPTH